MPAEKKDRNAIVSRAIRIASEEERTAYIAETCDDDEEKRQVEKQVAEHFQSGDQEKSHGSPNNNRHSPEQTREQRGANQAAPREMLKSAKKYPVGWSVAVGALFLLLAAALGGTALGIWEWRKANQARKAEQEAVQKSKQARENEEKIKSKFQKSEQVRQIREKERNKARDAEKAAQNSENETKIILNFFKKTLMSAGRPGDVSLEEAFWKGTRGKEDAIIRKNITLREALDETESKVEEAFSDLPKAEASVREMLGLAYLNLGEAAKAVQQYKRAFELRQAIQGTNDPETANCRNQLAIAYRLDGRPDDAARLFHRTPNSSNDADALAVRGTLLLTEKKPAQAELKLRECLIIRQNTQPDDWTTFETKSLLGQALLDQKKYTEAEPQLLAGYQGMKKHESKIPDREEVRLTKALERLVHLYEAWDKPDKAAKWRKELDAIEPAKKP